MFTCNRCGKCFDRKYHYTRHLERKTPCKIVNITQNSKFKCNYCYKPFTTKYNLERHEVTNLRCMQLKNQMMLENMNNQLNEMKDKMEQPTTTIINNNTVNNVNINLQLSKPGQELIDHITDEELLSILENDFSTVVNELMRLIYFNKNVPQNNNWCVAYLNNDYGALHYNNETDLIERLRTQNAINSYFQNMIQLLADRMNDLMKRNDLSSVQLKNINSYYHYVGADSPNSYDYNNIKMLAYNNRAFPVETWDSIGLEGEHKYLNLKRVTPKI